MLDLTQLLQVPQVDSRFDISPEGDKLAFAWNKTGEWQIYETSPSPLASLQLGEGNIKQITSNIGGKFNPRYSPDGSRLAYALDIDGSESYHLVVFDPSKKTHTDLTPNISHALQPNFCWSPDGNHLAFLSDEQGHFSPYILPSNGGVPQLVLDTGHPAWQVEWSPNGKYLAVSCEMHGQDYGIFIVDLETKEVLELPLNAHEPRWSLSGNKLAFHSDKHGWFDIGIYDLSTKVIEWASISEGDSQVPLFLSNTSTRGQTRCQIAYAQSKGAFNWIEILSPSLSPFENEVSPNIYRVGKGIHTGVRFTSDLKRMITTFSSPSQPADLWMIDINSGDSIQLTNSLPEALSNANFVMPREIHYDGIDGKQIPALLYRSKKVAAPGVVMIHGGPNWHYSAEWDPIIVYLASRGYVVLCPNYRGSTGYGREWQYAAKFDMGGTDTRDVAAGAQHLLREGIATKVAVTGRSHGGFLTMSCLTQFPELWCAGSAVVPFTNWFKSHADSREDLKHWNIENMGDPTEYHDRWYNASPYFFLDRINAAVQMICGGNDPRCPASDSIETRDKLLALGRSVDFLLYEGEGHVFLKIKNIIDSETKRIEFLERHLNG